VLPVLPGALLILASSILYAWWTDWAVLRLFDVAVLAVLTGATYATDLLLGAGGARRYGASRSGVVGALVGSLLGLLLIGPFGMVVGPIVGAATGELLRGHNWRRALRVGVGAGFGTVLSMVVRLGLGVFMLAYLTWRVAIS
jgi:uncharacterized protein YqgC (DUF456 family)